MPKAEKCTIVLKGLLALSKSWNARLLAGKPAETDELAGAA